MNVCDPDAPRHIFMVTSESVGDDWYDIEAIFTLYYDAQAYCMMLKEAEEGLVFYHVRAHQLR